MKQKYILGIYDKLINEIKYNRKTKDIEIISFLKKCSKKSIHLHHIQFVKRKNTINYTFQNKLHNLHPSAPKFSASNGNINPQLDAMIPQILKELNILDDKAELHWISKSNNISLIIQENCRIEDLSKEERFFLYCFHMVKNENHKILKNHKESVFSIKSKVKMKHYIHQKQYALENLSYSLVKEINPVVSKEIYSFSANYNAVDCLKITYVYLEKLLIFIEEEYRSYLDINIQVPYRTILVKEFEINDKLNYVQSRLLEININDDLLKMAFIPILKIATITIKEKTTYCEFNYCCEYIEEFYKQLKLKTELEESDIKGWLFDLNFNSLDFFDFETGQINSSLEKLESDIEKIVELYRWMKSYNQRQNKSHIKLNQKFPSIKEKLINWIEEEIEYFARKNKLELNNINSKPIVKIPTCFSVAQLSFFFFLLVKCDILIPKNHSDIFRLISNNFKTRATDQISTDSVKSKYYNVELASLNFVRAKVIELLNFTKS